MPEAHDGRDRIDEPGFSYLPRFIEADEATALIDYFAAITPIWEQRHGGDDHARGAGRRARRLTRPVYWLGAWQFASLGYYAEPHYREDRCLRAEPLPPVMQAILDRLSPTLEADHADGTPHNTCLINYYGREVGKGVPVDFARLRMHRDGEPGPVVMFSIGQPGLLEFIDPDQSPDPELGVWTRHRSVSILSGPNYKERLYHRVTQVRTGQQPKLTSRLDHFETRRISVSFRHVPEALISDLDGFPDDRQARVRGYVEELAEHSEHYAAQLAR
ncbi:MAG: alpha-ketoglutarate-dependent dioxygenase AlkB [Proteobacteria bacterium]|nr:alpha-ketoglutarate-dependent dioxygenase AlkB [Pseudomonadota bacterium]